MISLGRSQERHTISLGRPQELVFDSKTNDQWKQDMFAALNILLRNGYVVETCYEDCGIYVMHYDYSNSALAATQLVWIDTEHEWIANDCGGEAS